MAGRLGSVARAHRERAGVRLIDVAIEAGVSEASVHNFERGRWWLRQTDEIVEAYAALCGISVLEIWQGALNAPEEDC